MTEEAILVGEHGAKALTNLAELLRFFGITARFATWTELFGRKDQDYSARMRVLCSSDTFCEILPALAKESLFSGQWQRSVHSVFVYAGNEFSSIQRTLRSLSNNQTPEVMDLARGVFTVSDIADFCGPMSGLRINVSDSSAAGCYQFNVGQDKGASIITVEGGTVFLKLGYLNVPVFLFAGTEIVDVHAGLPSGTFDIREHLLCALPIVLYTQWAFPGTCWKAAEANACLVIDDPLLTRTYGCVDFRRLLALMKEHSFSTNIAFIPWNWQRSDQRVSRMFAENAKYYSLSVHGCDHTKAEFGTSCRELLSCKIHLAVERMIDHQVRTGLHHDRVMVFPQGVFSDAAMYALKHSELLAAVNNDTISADAMPRPISISDVWDVAVMSYHSFPLFTRRYPWEGIENFAFDSLLGKPSIIVIHHDYCRDEYRRLTDFVDQMNGLKRPPTWRGLGALVRRSYRRRRVSQVLVEAEAYAPKVRLMNESNIQTQFRIRKRETEPSSIRRIDAGSQEIEWQADHQGLTFKIDLPPRSSILASIQWYDPNRVVCRNHGGNLVHEISTMLRRYCCEVRDNYLVKYRVPFISHREGVS